MSKLLLLNCSQRKRLDRGELPAIERYDGPAFRLVRRYLERNLDLSVDVNILSAEYGLVSSNCQLPYYDRRLSKERAMVLSGQAVAKLKETLSSKPYTDLLFCLGKNYLEAIRDYNSVIPKTATLQVAAGSLGRKLSVLHDWLYGDRSDLRHQQNCPAPATGKVRLRGIEIDLSAEEILNVARLGIASHDPGVTRYQSWYVPIGDRRVAPKWLVSRIAALPVSKFSTSDALKVLKQMKIQVERL